MIDTKLVFSLGSLALAFTLSACGGSDDSEVSYCPQPLTVADANRITHFKEGAGRDPRDIAYEAMLTGVRATCEAGRRQLLVNLVVRVAAVAGPSVQSGVTS